MEKDRLDLLLEAHKRKKDIGSMAEEDYIEVIYELEKRYGSASPTDIAKILGVTPSSVTNMLKKLEERGMVEYRRYRNPRLTPGGRRLAETIARRHKKLYKLFKALGIDDEKANIEAELAEHFLSDETIDRLIDAYSRCLGIDLD